MHQRTLVELKHVAAAVVKPLKHVAALTKPLSSTSQPQLNLYDEGPGRRERHGSKEEEMFSLRRRRGLV